MELLYMWIGNYANINNTGFNFSVEYNFEILECEIRVKKRVRIPIKLFNDKFLNITAIAGINGSGKTSLISFIEYFFILNPSVRQSGILIYKDREDIINIYGSNNKIVNCGVGISFKTIKQLNELHEGVLPILYSSGIELLKDNILTDNFVHISGGRILEKKQIDANKFLYEEIVSLFETYGLPSGNKENNDFTLALSYILNYNYVTSSYKKDELKKLIYFLCNHSTAQYNFIPQWLMIKFNFNFIYSTRNQFGKNNKFIKKIIGEKDRFHPLNGSDHTKDLKKSLLIQMFLFIIYSAKNKVNFINLDIDSKISELKSLNSSKEISVLIAQFIEESDFTYSGRLTNFDKIKELNNNLDSYLENINVNKYENGAYYLKTDLNTYNLFKLYFEFWNLTDFAFNFEMNELSTGEMALLNLLARIYSISNNSNDGKTIWLFIDEGELYLHPELQRRFFSDLHDYLPIFFNNNKVQLILTTHSPFILSNLPKENIILLNKNANNQNCQIISNQLYPQTFGANIHDLLANSFFMSNGVMGKFAEDIVNDLFNFLLSKESKRTWTKESCKSVIDIVAEPIIQNQLQVLFGLKDWSLASK